MRHDQLLFRCAYPRSARELERAEAALEKIELRDRVLPPETSGIAGTSVDVIFSWDIARWLTRRFPGTAAIDWDDPPEDDRLAVVLTPLIPVLRERIVDANVPYLDFARAHSLEWYVDHLDSVTYDLLGLWIRWKFPLECSRTRMRRTPRTIFCDPAIIARRDVSIARELAAPPLPIRELSPEQGEAALDMVRAALATRYRELYAATFGEPATVISADAGRGLEIVLFALRPDKRLPVRAGYAPFFFRNGVPTGYGDAFALGERIEVSFNIFPAFREGESAWCFARLLALYRQLFRSTIFTIDPYQIGLGNEEAIESGAFWFYRKLGFRSIDPKVERLARAEEKRKARSSPATLRELAASGMILKARA
ncbi:MAG TPA: hypothetical protein VKH35_02835 [Thermoanaerobaculia bacterium]|nr:hypothetical protein [Thermoanaerobaculia bacterium]